MKNEEISKMIDVGKTALATAPRAEKARLMPFWSRETAAYTKLPYLYLCWQAPRLLSSGRTL
ncbi:MAG: hypothetical protein ACI4AD_06040 [Roseburia sp.]